MNFIKNKNVLKILYVFNYIFMVYMMYRIIKMSPSYDIWLMISLAYALVMARILRKGFE